MCLGGLEILSTPGVDPCCLGPTYCITRKSLSASQFIQRGLTIHFRLMTRWVEIVRSFNSI